MTPLQRVSQAVTDFYCRAVSLSFASSSLAGAKSTGKRAGEEGRRSCTVKRELRRASGSKASLLSAGLLLIIVSGTRAQETGGVDAESGRRAVIKGKAPVANELLKVKLPRPYEAALPNGLRVFVQEDHRLPTVRFSLSMKAGTLLATKPGLAELTASMLMEGTSTRTYQQIGEQLEERGTNVNATASMETTTLTGAGTSDQSSFLVELMADVLLHPTFPSEGLERARSGRGGGGFGGRGGGGRRGGGAGSPIGLASQRAEQLFYGDTPFARAPGTPAQRLALTLADVHAFYDAFYHPNGAVLAITGDVNAKEIVAQFTQQLSDWKPSLQEVPLPTGVVAPKTATHIYLIDRPGSTQTYLLFGNVGVSRTDPDYLPLVVANRILGGGASARLFQNLREDKGYTYGASSTLTALHWPGLWEASASVRTLVTEAAVKEFFYEFTRIQDKPVTTEELTRAKRSLIGGFARTLESADSALGRTLERIQYNLSPDYWDTYAAQIEAVTVEDVQRVARKYLGTNRIQLIAVGERSQIEEGLKKYGPVTVVAPVPPRRAISEAPPAP